MQRVPGSALHLVLVTRYAQMVLQGLILYSALTCASTPVALRYLYLQDQPPAAPVLAAVQTTFAAVILVLISGPVPCTCCVFCAAVGSSTSVQNLYATDWHAQRYHVTDLTCAPHIEWQGTFKP